MTHSGGAGVADLKVACSSHAGRANFVGDLRARDGPDLTHLGRSGNDVTRSETRSTPQTETTRSGRPRWERNMGVKNYLIEGVSCTGKTSVCDELQRRGYHSIDGDVELAYWGDPKTGEPLEGSAYEHHTWIWDVDKVRALVADQSHAALFFCGGSRNFDRFIDLFDGVFVLEVDLDTLNRRLAVRPEDEWGGRASEEEAIARLQHATKEDIPKNAITIDATAPIARVVDAILGNAN